MRIKKSDLATEKEIVAFFTKLMRDHEFDIALRLRAAEMLCKHLLKPLDTASSNFTPLCVQVDYGQGGESTEAKQ